VLAMLMAYNPDQKVMPRRAPGRVHALMMANATFAAISIFGWSALAQVIADPLAWATWNPVNHAMRNEEFLEYPVCMLWLMPMAGIAISWLALKARRSAVAYAGQFIPIGVISLMVIFFYFVPEQWR
jgi:apolipoprotein N-acyltransferase